MIPRPRPTAASLTSPTVDQAPARIRSRQLAAEEMACRSSRCASSSATPTILRRAIAARASRMTLRRRQRGRPRAPRAARAAFDSAHSRVRAEEVEYCAEKFSLKSDPSQVPLRERRARGRAAVTVNEDFPPPDDDATRAQVAEVEVDRETGRARLRASLTAHDVGRSSIRSRTRASRRRSSAGMGQS